MKNRKKGGVLRKFGGADEHSTDNVVDIYRRHYFEFLDFILNDFDSRFDKNSWLKQYKFIESCLLTGKVTVN